MRLATAFTTAVGGRIMGKEQLPSDAGYFVLPRRVGMQILIALICLAVTAGGGAAWVRFDVARLYEIGQSNRQDIDRLMSERDEAIKLGRDVEYIKAIVQEVRDELRSR